MTPTALPADFAKIPEAHPKGAALVSVAGTPQAREAAIANTSQPVTKQGLEKRFRPVPENRLAVGRRVGSRKEILGRRAEGGGESFEQVDAGSGAGDQGKSGDRGVQ